MFSKTFYWIFNFTVFIYYFFKRYVLFPFAPSARIRSSTAILAKTRLALAVFPPNSSAAIVVSMVNCSVRYSKIFTRCISAILLLLFLFYRYFFAVQLIIASIYRSFVWQRQSYHDPVRLKNLTNLRFSKSHFLPYRENIRNATTCALADVDEVEHFDECAVTRIGNSAAFGNLYVDAKIAGIGKDDTNLVPHNDKPLPAVIVNIDQTVCQRLAQSLMDRRSILSPPSSRNGTFSSCASLLYTRK